MKSPIGSPGGIGNPLECKRNVLLSSGVNRFLSEVVIL